MGAWLYYTGGCNKWLDYGVLHGDYTLVWLGPLHLGCINREVAACSAQVAA